MRSFLLPGYSSDLLYWWNVLEHAGMLQYTIAMLPEDVGATTESAPSIMTNSSDKPGKDDNFLKDIGTLSRNWEEDNELKRQSISVSKERMEFEKESFSTRMTFEKERMERQKALEEQRMAMDGERMAMEKERMTLQKNSYLDERQSKAREFERQIERDIDLLEDQLDELRNVDNPVRKELLEKRIANLKRKINSLY